MAWRIHEHVIRGEIDNRIRGRVTGRIWFSGRAEPVHLDLAGNAWHDLAGRHLIFVNPDPQPGLPASFPSQQPGTTGDITASRKVRVPDIPLDQIGEYSAAGKPFPWHWGNSLYLEWFSATQGRVVIESASYQLTISPGSTWEMDPADEAAQRAENAAALTAFVERTSEALAAENTEPFTRPQTEAEAEKMQADSDRLMDRVTARLEREGDSADYEKILTEEIARARRERGELDPTPEQEADNARLIDEMNAAAEEALEQEKADAWKQGADASDDDPDDPFSDDDKHPLCARSFALSLRVIQDTAKRGWANNDASAEHPVTMLVASISSAGAKLAGAPSGEDWPPPLDFCAGIIVRLKKAISYLEDARLAADSCREESLVDSHWITEVVRELDALSAGTQGLVAELRARLEASS